MAGFHVPSTEIFQFFKLPTLIFCSFLDNVEIIVNEICFSKEVGVTERPRSLNPIKAIAMAICPIIVHFSTQRARTMHDVVWRGMWICVRSKSGEIRDTEITEVVGSKPTEVKFSLARGFCISYFAALRMHRNN